MRRVGVLTQLQNIGYVMFGAKSKFTLIITYYFFKRECDIWIVKVFTDH